MGKLKFCKADLNAGSLMGSGYQFGSNKEKGKLLKYSLQEEGRKMVCCFYKYKQADGLLVQQMKIQLEHATNTMLLINILSNGFVLG